MLLIKPDRLNPNPYPFPFDHSGKPLGRPLDSAALDGDMDGEDSMIWGVRSVYYIVLLYFSCCLQVPAGATADPRA